MKPICAKCDLFMRVKHNGEWFEERMPGPNGAKREILFAKDLRCSLCGWDQPCHGHPLQELEEALMGMESAAWPQRMKPGPLEGWQPYKLWVGDIWECRGCGAQVIVGVPPKPLAEHFQPEYAALVSKLGVTRRIDDC